MQLPAHVRQMATYNQWMNDKLYQACASLNPAELAAARGAFFSSILGTLNHLLVADTIWLKRIQQALPQLAVLQPLADVEMPASLDALVYDNLTSLTAARQQLDQHILALAAALDDEALQQIIGYTNIKGVRYQRQLFSLLMHLFNHQTHHRGQVTTLLSQAGVDVGVTDLLALLPEY